MTKYTFSEWIEHDGSGMPVSGETYVVVRSENPDFMDENEKMFEEHLTFNAGYWNGNGSPEESNWLGKDDASIIAYKIATPAN